MSVDIPPLVWKEHSRGWSAVSPFGAVDVYSNDSGATYQLASRYGGQWMTGFLTADAAKAAAEELHASRGRTIKMSLGDHQLLEGDGSER